MKNLETILLKRSTNCWTATSLIDGKANPQMIEVFGTHVLPTAFTENASGREVYASIQSKNPKAKVIIIVD